MSTGVIILAAGNSSRLGQPKQLLDYGGNSFLNRIAGEAISFAGESVLIVTGAHHKKIEESLENKTVLTCFNQNWHDGMASSIKTGLKHLLLVYPEISNCIITVCDQPYLSADIFHKLLVKYQTTGKGIIASAYSKTTGVPVLFDRHYFDVLLTLKGQEGARKLLRKFKEDVAVVPFEKGAVDIDTPEDYIKLIYK